ncbi:MAG TPA: ABC transporter permease [Micromonosporaceae bacterium]
MRSRFSTMLWVLWECGRMQVREMSGHSLGLIIGVVQPAVFLMVTLGANPDLSPAQATRLVVAVVLTSLWASIVWMAGGILQRELELGTLAANVASPHPGFLVLLGKCLGATVRTIGAILLATTATLVVMGASIRLDRPVLLGVGLVTVVLSGTALGMLLSCLFLLTRYGAHLSSALMYPIFILGGLMIPVDLLPPVVRPVSTVISLRWAQEFLAGAAAGSARIPAFVLLVGLTVAYFAVAIWTFNVVVDRARRRGTLELV